MNQSRQYQKRNEHEKNSNDTERARSQKHRSNILIVHVVFYNGGYRTVIIVSGTMATTDMGAPFPALPEGKSN
jgi:hypothetical protein